MKNINNNHNVWASYNKTFKLKNKNKSKNCLLYKFMIKR